MIIHSYVLVRIPIRFLVWHHNTQVREREGEEAIKCVASSIDQHAVHVHDNKGRCIAFMEHVTLRYYSINFYFPLIPINILY